MSGATSRALRTIGLGACVVLATAGLSFAAGRDSGGALYHGCVDDVNGNLRVSDTCRQGEHAITWNELGPTGPAGPAGPVGPKGDPGERGPAGPGLDGSPCVLANGSPGTVGLVVNADNTITVSCNTGASWCATHTPSVGPQMTVSCDGATRQFTYACEPGWLDRNGDHADGCEASAAGLAPIPFDQVAAATLAARGFAHGVETTAVPADCGGTFATACVDGTPADPLPAMTIDGNQRAGDFPRLVVIPDQANSRFDMIARVRLSSGVIPVVLPVAGACGVRFDTTAGSRPDLTITFRDNVVAPDGPTVVSDVAVSGLETSDYALTGPFACSVVNVSLDSLTEVLQHALAPWVARRGVYCGAPEPAYFQGCP